MSVDPELLFTRDMERAVVAFVAKTGTSRAVTDHFVLTVMSLVLLYVIRDVRGPLRRTDTSRCPENPAMRRKALIAEDALRWEQTTR